jgi:hypothetical protein
MKQGGGSQRHDIAKASLGLRATVAQLLEELMKLPKEAVVLMESGGGLSRVSALDFIEGRGLGAPAEVILLPNMDE